MVSTSTAREHNINVNIDCDFIEDGENFTCSRCGFKTKTKNLRRNCGPSKMARIVNFGAALVKHVESGMEKGVMRKLKRYSKSVKSVRFIRMAFALTVRAAVTYQTKTAF